MLKKLSLKSYIKLLILILILPMVLLFGCKTLPESFTVEPLDLLDAENEFYISIPAQADPDFIKYFLVKNTENISLKDLSQINERINHIYCGITHNKNNFTIQTVIKDNIPSKYINNQLKKNKQFNKSTYETTAGINYSVFSYENMAICFPSNNLAIAGRNVENLLDNYDYIRSTGVVLPNEDFENIEMYNYLNDAADEIRFYSSKPQSFLSILIGSQMDLHLKSVYGAFKVDKDFTSQYVMEMHLIFKNDKFLKAGKTLLNLAFSLTGGKVEILENNELKISDIKIKKSQLYDLLVL